ncbi:uncharacterized protein MONBRDRAFT_33789 [Monosiga brevicollis MX1]|uniref:EF-hand domain-containing protein n=1 Tax=Monosiga brevicollis TaxID=81824 RepID=A9V7I6_MONBE|nr:uncharacterized protein MONBRDRAFT_33789 [Monosiga brevicollis MX1]EDQ86520.1 predicted protein [Monosiga brevicollis MX1]|eukprot:XP_001748633.1 hypothetical protein [Monosiga brevicollis MX1]
MTMTEPEARPERIKSARLMTRVPWEQPEQVIQFNRELMTSQARPLEDTEGSRRGLSLRNRNRAATAPATGVRPNLANLDNLSLGGLPRAASARPPRRHLQRSFSVRRSSHPGLHLDAFESLSDDDEENSEDDFSLASTALLRCSQLDLPDIVRQYRQLCNDYGTVPVAVVERSLVQSDAIVLKNHSVGIQGCRALAETLQDYDKIDQLDLSSNDIQDGGAASLGKLLTESSYIKTLRMDANNIRTRGLITFCTSIQSNRSLRVLSMADNSLLCTHAAPISEAIKSNTSIARLGLAHNRFGDAACVSFGEMLANARGEGLAQATSVRNLLLSHNACGDPGVIALARGLREFLPYWMPWKPAVIYKSWTSMASPSAPQRVNASLGYNPEGFNGIPFENSNITAIREQMQEVERRRLSSVSSGNFKPTPRRSSIAFVRRPTGDFDPSWTADEAWRMGFTDQGVPRTDSDWLSQRDDYDPSWSATEAWQRGYYPDGKPRETEERAAKRASRMSVMKLEPIGKKDYKVFEERASETFGLLYPNMNDPMAILETYVRKHRMRLVDLFAQIDKDKSGTLTVREVTEACTELRIPLNAVQQEELMFRLDIDGDGEIDYHELCEGRRVLHEEATGFKFRHPDDTPSSEEDDDDDDDEARARSRRGYTRAARSARSRRAVSDSDDDD